MSGGNIDDLHRGNVSVTVPYRCTNDERCPGRSLHSCEELASICKVVDELHGGPPNTLSYMTAVVLLATTFCDPRADDAHLAIAAHVGYPIDFVRHTLDWALWWDIFPENGEYPSRWLEHPIGILCDALVVVGAFKKTPGENPEYSATDHIESASSACWEARPGRCHNATRYGRQCHGRVPGNDLFCKKHPAVTITWESATKNKKTVAAQDDPTAIAEALPTPPEIIISNHPDTEESSNDVAFPKARGTVLF